MSTNHNLHTKYSPMTPPRRRHHRNRRPNTNMRPPARRIHKPIRTRSSSTKTRRRTRNSRHGTSSPIPKSTRRMRHSSTRRRPPMSTNRNIATKRQRTIENFRQVQPRQPLPVSNTLSRLQSSRTACSTHYRPRHPPPVITR